MRAYPRYRDSGVEWIGEVPEHWGVTRLRENAQLGAGASPHYSPEDDGEVAVVGANGHIGSTVRANAHRGVAVGRVGTSGSVRRIEEPVWLSDNVLFVNPDTTVWDEAFLYHVLTRAGLPNLASQTAQPLLTQTVLGRVSLPLPPLDEQRAIAAYLDRETERIDALVAKKRLLIERLEEYRTALITRTVTRGLPPEAARAAGLDPSPRLKPSGVEWLGDVPEHWEVGALRHAVVLQRGHDLPADTREEGDVPIVSSGGVFGSHAFAAAQGPGIVTGRYGSIGEFQLVDGPYWPLNTTLYTVDLRGNHVRFLRYMLMNLKSLFLVNSAKSAVPGVDRNDLHPVHTAVPPKAEQKAIADYLDKETNKLSELVGRAEAAIERSQEYRTALITAAVTGKIDVRETATAAAGPAG